MLFFDFLIIIASCNCSNNTCGVRQRWEQFEQYVYVIFYVIKHFYTECFNLVFFSFLQQQIRNVLFITTYDPSFLNDVIFKISVDVKSHILYMAVLSQNGGVLVVVQITGSGAIQRWGKQFSSNKFVYNVFIFITKIKSKTVLLVLFKLNVCCFLNNIEHCDCSNNSCSVAVEMGKTVQFVQICLRCLRSFKSSKPFF